MRPVLQTTVDLTAAGRQLGQTHADLCAVEFRKHVVSCSSLRWGFDSVRETLSAGKSPRLSGLKGMKAYHMPTLI